MSCPELKEEHSLVASFPSAGVGWGEFTKRRTQNKWAWPH